MLRHWKHFLLVLFAVCCTAVPLTAQTNYGSEEDLKKQANKLFEEEEFIKAYPLFSQLLALYPKDPNYNYKFGVCMLFSVADKEKAISYIEFASKSPEVEKEVFYYLGRAYHLNYRFNDAITSYKNYKSHVSEKQWTRLQVDQNIKQCNNGKKLLKNLTDLVVMDKKELSRANFFNAYNLTEFNAKVIVKTDDFISSYDKKKKEKGIMYQEQGKTEIYYSSYGDDGKNGKDIFIKKRLPNGEFGRPINIGYPVNTEYDEDYPFLHPNGKILYFCSKGHNSMGGYDVFKSEYNEETGTWTKPVNMDFAINTPDDDYLFISDADDKIGYFASTRASSGDMVTVYKIVIDRKPADIAIVTGKVKREDNANGLAAKITVKNMDNGMVVGVFNSKSNTGNYVMNLPNGGKFLFTVEAPGFKPHSEMVEIPVQYELKPLGQEIRLRLENGKEVVQIINKFDENVDDEDYLNAMDFIKKKANLDVNYGMKDTLNLYTNVDDTDDVKDPKMPDDPIVTNDDIIKTAYNDAKDAQKEANDLRKDADNANYLANQKNDELKEKQEDLNKQEQLVNNTTDPRQKQTEQEKYEDMKKETDLLQQQTILTNNMSKKLDEDAKKKQEDADFALKYAKDLERALNSSNTSQQTITQLDATKKMLDDKMKKEGSGTQDFYADIKKQADAKQKDADKSKTKVEDLKIDITQTQSEIDRLKKEADNQKDPQLKQSLLDQVEELVQNKNDQEKELLVVQKNADDQQRDADNLKTQFEYTDDLINQIKDGNYTNVVVKNDQNDPVKTDYTQNTAAINKKYEQQLKENELNPDALNREQKKSEIYANWSKDAKKEQDELKKKLSTTTNPEDKKKIQDQVTALNSVVTDKKKESETSKTNAEAIKQQQLLVQNNPQDTTTKKKTNTPSTSNSVVVSTISDNIKQSEAMASDLNRKYDDELKTLENISDPLVKEEKKTEIYKKWADELNAQTAMLQQQIDTSASINLSDKIALQGGINKIKDQQKETQKLVVKSQKKVDELKSGSQPDVQKTTVVKIQENIDQSNKTIAGLNTKHDEEIKNTENFTDPYERENAKSVIYKKWTSELTSQVLTLQQQLDTSTTLSPGDKQKLQQEIDKIKDKQTQTENLALISQKKADDLRNDQVVVKNDQPVKDTTVIVKNDQPVKDTTILVKNDVKAPVYPDITPNFNYSSPTASNDVKKVKELVKETNDMKRRSDSLYNVAQQTTDPDKKVELLDQVSDLETSLKKKRDETHDLIANVNKSEFTKNQQNLEDLSKQNYENDQQLVDAIKHDDLSKSLFNDAQKKRDESKYMTGQEKENTLKEANDLEVQALNEQNKSKQIYASMKVVAVKNDVLVKNDVKDTNTVVKNDAVVKDTSTVKNDVLVKNDTRDTSSAVNREVAGTTEYRTYNDLMNESRDRHKKAADLLKQAQDLLKQAQMKSDESQRLIESTVNITDENQKNEVLKKAQQLDEESIQLLSRGDSLRKQGEDEQTLSDNKRKEAETYVQNVDKTKSDQIVALYNNLNPDTPVTGTQDPVVKNDTPPVIVKTTVTDKLEIKNTPVYSKTRPIPINTTLPGGVIFKVQVGAFRNPIPQDLFKGLTPLDGQTTGTGLTRYMAGIFTTPENANKAKDQIRGMGYRDAFVVAFYNGKRISYDDAIAMLNGTKKMPDVKQDDPLVKKDPEVIVKNDPPVQNDPRVIKNDDPVVINDVKSTDVKSYNGMFYTVQVGVYSRKVTSAQLYGISPLNSDPVGNVIRYSTGAFNNFNEANALKNKIVQRGVKDAFVVAYYKGKRYLPEDAALLLAKEGSGILINGDQLVKVKDEPNDPPVIKDDPPIVIIKDEPKNDPPVVVNQAETLAVDTTTPPAPYVVKPNTAETDSGVVFKVQIGAFRDEVPIDIANKFIRIQKQGIKNYLDESSGLTVYTVGRFRLYDEAQKTRDGVMQQGMSDAFVIAFKDGQRIPIEDAKKLAGGQ